VAAKILAAPQRRIFHKKLRIAPNARGKAQVVGRATLGSIEPPAACTTRGSPCRFNDFRTQRTPGNAAGIRVAQ
jgi:hypothetical protein